MTTIQKIRDRLMHQYSEASLAEKLVKSRIYDLLCPPMEDSHVQDLSDCEVNGNLSELEEILTQRRNEAISARDEALANVSDQGPNLDRYKAAMDQLDNLLKELRDKTPPSTKHVAMSEVESSVVDDIVHSALELKYVAGPDKPKDTPDTHIPDFPMDAYPTGRRAAPDFLKWLKGKLEDKIADFANRFDVVDVHKQLDLLKITFPSLGMQFNGSLHGAVVPHRSLSYVKQLRIGLGLIHSKEDKLKYRADHPGMTEKDKKEMEKEEAREEEEVKEEEEVLEEQGEETRHKRRKTEPSFKLAGSNTGQAVMQLLAACTSAEYPCDIISTDGHVWHILRLRGSRICVWENLSTGQAIRHIAEFLDKEAPSDVSFSKKSLTQDELKAPLQLLAAHNPNVVAVGDVLQQAAAVMDLEEWTDDERLGLALKVVQVCTQRVSLPELLGAPPEFMHLFR